MRYRSLSRAADDQRGVVFDCSDGWLLGSVYDARDMLGPSNNLGTTQKYVTVITIKSYQYVFPRGCIHVHAKSAICEQLVIKTFHITAD